MCTSRHQSGISLVELIMFIVIVSISLAGVIGVLNLNTSHSADPAVRKQAVALAESLLEEIELRLFTYCDPDDPLAATAGSAAGCIMPEGLGPETAGETRYSSTTPFDNVNDYHNFTMNPVVDITGTPIASLAGYRATVTISNTALCAGAVCASSSDSLLISVRVDGPGGFSVTLDGYRTQYAPNATQ